MGICYTQQQEWEAYQSSYRSKRKNRKKNEFSSIIYEEKSFHESFVSKVENSFRQDLHNTLNNIASGLGSVAFGSLTEIADPQMQGLYKSLQNINADGQKFDHNQVLTLCNLKTKNFLHTHKIKHPCFRKFNQVSACPYTSNHIIEYDLWKIIPIQNDRYYIYHPLTQSFLGVENGKVAGGTVKYQWKIHDYGNRRNGGFLKIITEVNGEQLELCMTDQQGILQNHRQLQLCKQKHISHIWQLSFGECILQ